MPQEQRDAVHAYLSSEAAEAWRDFSEYGGVSVTSLIEALGIELATTAIMDKEGDPVWAEAGYSDWIRRARKIDADRRRRDRRRTR